MTALLTPARPVKRALHGTRRALEPYAVACSIAALVAAAAVWAGDLATGADVAFTLLYLAPIAFVVWCVGLPAGVCLSLLSALGCFVIRAGEDTRVSSFALLWNTLGELGIFIVFSATLNAFRNRFDAQTALALSDPLTGLGNVRALHEALDVACESTAPLTMVYVDIDGFKRVNDELGHASGDALLTRVATALRSALREGDVAVRLGGDEFGVLLPATDHAQATLVLARLAAVQDNLREGAQSVTLSLGAVTFTRPPRNPARIVATADRAMYSSKRNGGARVTHELVPHIDVEEG